jgi:two-component system sensor histidine kinase BarA
MLQTRPFTRTILLLGVLPVGMAIVFLTVSFVLLQRYHITGLENQLTTLTERTLMPLLAKSSRDSTEFTHAVHALTHLELVSHISLYDQQSESITNFALPIKTLQQLPFEPTIKSLQLIDDTLYSTLPLSDQESPAWLIIGIHKSPLTVLQYRGYLILIAVAVLVLFWTLYFASRLYYAITAPLQNILTDLRQTLSTSSNKPLGNTQNHLYDELIETLNELILMQQSIRDEMQNNVDQSTKELLETLETVEIQNIELDFARKNALQASRAKSEFLANTSHELRTPLNGILGFTSLLLKTIGLSNQQKDYLSTIEQSAHGLLTVINDILDFSKLETGQLTLEYKPIYVRELIEEVFAIYAPQAHEKNMRLLSIINHNVPRNLLGDPQRLKQVINNLISNAIKFSTHGNIIVRAASLGETDNQSEIKFSVTDNGIGLTEGQQVNLFSAFTKVDSSDSRFQGGTGLGLAIAKGLVDRMNGEIGVESEPQKGSTFWFTVRLGLDRQRISQSPLVNSLYGVNALVFDCNPVCRMEITHLLTNWGVSFLEESHFSNIANTLASNSNDAPVDLLILDAYSEENGFEREKLLSGIQRLTNTFRLPTIILAPPAIQRALQNDVIGLHTQIVPRPVAHSLMHQTMCNLLNIAQRFSSTGDQPETPQSRLKSKGTKILVVDDHPANLKLVSEFLKGLGVEVKTTNSGTEALTICEREIFSLILMDVQMPGLDGYATTKLLRSKEINIRTPIVALTAHAVNEQKTQLLLAGMDDFLSKPVSEDDLRHIIERWAASNTSALETTEKLEAPHTAPAPAAPTSEKKSTTFDWKESLRLAKNKPDLATDLLKILISSLDETLIGIRAAIQENNMQSLLEITHKFHGGCCYCGVPAARQASKTLEEVLHKRDYSNVAQLVDKLLAEISDILAWSHTIDIETLFGDFDD